MENLTNQVMNKRNEGVFDEFYLFYLKQLEKSLDELLDKQFNFEFDKKEVLSEAISALKDELVNIGSKALLSELQKFKEEKQNDCTYKEYISFITDEQFQLYFDNKYVVLKELLEQKVKTFVKLFEECFTRLSADKKNIEESFKIELNEIKNISFSVDGDTHNGGKSVIRLDINDGKSLFYKPHNLAMDIIFKDIMKIIEKRLGKFQYEHVPTLDRKEYGWQEKAEYSESKDEKEIKNYYYSVGASLAVFYLLGTEDIHSGNLISRGNMPAYIDLEVLMANKNLEHLSNINNNKYSGLNKVLLDSVLGVYILPNNIPTNLIDIDISALTSGQNLGKSSEKLSYLALADKGTADIHYEKMSSESHENLSIVKHKGKVVDANAYIDDLAEGFKDAYEVLLDEKQSILDILESHGDDKIRQVMRATYVYGKFIDAAYHPKYLQSISERKRIFSLSNGEKTTNEIRSKIARQEAKMLYRNDIPYFYTKFDSSNLFYTCDGSENVIKNVYTKSIKETLVEKLERFSKTDMDRQIDLIYLSFANFDKHRLDSIERQDRRLYKKLCDNNNISLPERYVKSIYESLLDKCIDVEDISAIIGLEPDIRGDYRISYLSGNLYNGLGTVYFMALADKKYGNKNADKILRLVRGIEKIMPYKLVPNNIGSAFNGLVGRLYVYKQLYKSTKLQEYADYYNEILDYLVETDLQEGDVLDYVTGVCGGITALVNLYKNDKDLRLKKIIEKYADFVRDKTEKLDFANTLNGMAHGYSGFIMALFKLYEFTKDKYYYDKGVELVMQENTSYSQVEGNWKDTRDGTYGMVFWCHGAAGIALTRTATLKYIEDNKELRKIWVDDIKNALLFVKKEGLDDRLKHGICHGITGNLVILNYIAKVQDDKNLQKFVRQKLNEVLVRLGDESIHYENKLNVQDIGFMLGLSGIGYSIMQLLDNNIPNVLLLEE